MLKLKSNVMELLKVNVKPKYLDKVVKSIIDNPPTKCHEIKAYAIDDAFSNFRQQIIIRLDAEDFENDSETFE